MDLELIEECFLKAPLVFCNHTNSSSSVLCSLIDKRNSDRLSMDRLIINAEDILILVVQDRIRICIKDLDTELYCNQTARLMGYYDIFGSRRLTWI